MRQFIFGIFLCLNFRAISSQAQVELKHAYTKGTGCPIGTARVVLTPDNSTFSILYDQMTTSASGIRVTGRKNCDAFITLTFPRGKMLELEAVEYRGFLSLDGPGAWGYVSSKAYFLNGKVVTPEGLRMISTDMSAPIYRFFRQGPLEQNFEWNSSDFKGRSGRAMSPCLGETTVKVLTEVMASNGPEGGKGVVSLDTADGTFSQKYRMILKNCE